MKAIMFFFLLFGGFIFYLLTNAQTTLMDAEKSNNDSLDIFEQEMDCASGDYLDCMRLVDHFRELAMGEKDASKKMEYASKADRFLSSTCDYRVSYGEGCLRLGHLRGSEGKSREALDAYRRGCARGMKIACQWENALDACNSRNEQSACKSLQAAWSVAQ